MAAPFYNAIKGTTSGTPGTGSFTPNAAATGFEPWSGVAAGWMGMVRYEDGSAWERSYGYWDGTAITRPAGGFVASSTASQLSLTSAATASLIMDAGKIQPNFGSRTGTIQAANGSASFTVLGSGSVSFAGTNAVGSLATTNWLTEQCRVQITSATTANAQAGVSNGDTQAVYSTAGGRGGFELIVRFGCSQLPTAPRVFMGLTDNSFVGSTAEPSAFAQSFAVLGKDSGDTNLQFITNDAGVTAGKTDTGIALVANGWYESAMWAPPGGGKICFLLFRLDTGAIFYAERTTDLPANGSLLKWNALTSLNGTDTGTAIITHIGSMALRAGG